MNFKFCYIIFCTIICFIVLSVPTFAKENSDNVIRVGSFEETYNVVNEKGERSGYGYEYLQDIAGYAGWTYKYITSDWKNCFTQLENGEIDILGGISYTDERAENMLFSDMPMGEEKYYIYTDASNMDLTAGNLDSFEGKNIGVFKDNITEDVLNEWELKYGLHTQHVNVSNTAEVMDKLSKHEIDCFVSVEESRWEESDISPITSIGETEIYFAINPERPDIKEALDSAMRRIKDDNPFYTDDLYRRYLSAQSSSFLSKEEREWIGQHGAIRIGYLNQDGGISSVDPSTGKLTGVITDYVDLAENCLQGQTLEFELNGYDTRSELLQALQDGKIDLIFHANQNPYFAETNGFALSDTLLTLNMAAITAKDSFDENKENVAAVEKDNFVLKAYLSYNYPQWKVMEYETSDAAVKAMQKGEADFKDTIFDAFTRAESSITNKIQGTGLGMAITKNLVEAMGGTIDVDSELGQGSCFEVLLDLKIAEDRTVAFTVSTLSGSRYLLSFIISTFTKSPHPSSLAMRAMRTASFASLAPEVFGSNVTLSGIKSRMFSFFFVLVRRTANVIICAPAFSTAALISSMEYFPDPKIKREENSFPPNVNVSFFIFSSFFLVFSLVFFFK
jgi:ABC-type amino acid transport substrate-binding protein